MAEKVKITLVIKNGVGAPETRLDFRHEKSDVFSASLYLVPETMDLKTNK